MRTIHFKTSLHLFIAVIFSKASFAQTTFKYGGYVKLDNNFSVYENGKPPNAHIDNFHIPGFIPVNDSNTFYTNNFHVKESRFNFDVSGTIREKPVHAFVEVDFLLSPSGDERISNSYSPRLRHFFFDYNGLLFGQTWSTFMIVTLPEDLDFIGAAEGVVFQRQPQIRYTLNDNAGSWQFALENSESTITPHGGGGRMTSSGIMPAGVIRRNFKGKRGSFSVAAIGRQIRYVSPDAETVSVAGYGITAGGKIKTGARNDIRMMITGGNGLGRYVALNFVNGAVADSTDNSLTTINSVNGYLAYLFHWSEKWKSSINASLFFGDNKESLTGGGVNKNAQSYSANILYTPAKSLLIGMEYMYIRRELQDNTDGVLHRIQFSAKYKFGFSHTSKPKE